MIKAKNDYLIEEFILAKYAIFQDGRIYNANGRQIGFIKLGEAAHRGLAYRYVKFKGKELKVHRIIYRTYVGKFKPGYVIHHMDGDQMNNAAYNLKQVTQCQNIQYSYL